MISVSMLCLSENGKYVFGFFPDYLLTNGSFYDIISMLNPKGEVSERFKEPVLKTGDAAMHRGFESHPLRHAIFGYRIHRRGEIPKW